MNGRKLEKEIHNFLNYCGNKSNKSRYTEWIGIFMCYTEFKFEGIALHFLNAQYSRCKRTLLSLGKKKDELTSGKNIVWFQIIKM